VTCTNLTPASLSRLASRQAQGVAVGVLAAHAIQVECGLGLACQIHQLRCGGLHPESQFHRIDHSLQRRLTGMLLAQSLILTLNKINSTSLSRGVTGEITEIFDWWDIRTSGRCESGSLMLSGEPRRSVVANISVWIDGDKSRQIAIFCAKAVADP
jgi:hypothetical protein